MHSDFTTEQIEYLLEFTKTNHYYRSGGSDYHGVNKPSIEMAIGKGNLNIPSELIKECMVFGMPAKDGDVTLSVKVCYDKDYIEKQFGNITEDEIKDKVWNWVKEINKTMPKYKYVKKLILTDEELVKTTTLKIKRNIEMEKIMKNN